MEAKVKERFEQAKTLYEKEFKAHTEALITWWNDTFGNGLGDMIKELAKAKGLDRHSTTDRNIRLQDVNGDDWYIYPDFDRASGCFKIGYNNSTEIRTWFPSYAYNDVESLGCRVRELEQYKSDYRLISSKTESLVNAITSVYENRVAKQNEDLDEIFKMLGQETEPTKRCKVTVEWI